MMVAVVAVTLTCFAAYAFVPDTSKSLGRQSAGKKISSFLFPLRSSSTSSDMPKLPADVVKYSQVPKEAFFVKEKIPRGLLKDHTTKAGTWGVIRVNSGKLLYRIEKPEPALEFELSPGIDGIIEPQRLHRVEPLTEDCEFCVEFYRLPNTGPVDEKREGL